MGECGGYISEPLDNSSKFMYALIFTILLCFFRIGGSEANLGIWPTGDVLSEANNTAVERLLSRKGNITLYVTPFPTDTSPNLVRSSKWRSGKRSVLSSGCSSIWDRNGVHIFVQNNFHSSTCNSTYKTCRRHMWTIYISFQSYFLIVQARVNINFFCHLSLVRIGY